MNTPVNFEIAKLLKEKQWEIPTLYCYFEDAELIQNTFKDTVGMDYGSEFEVEFSELTENWNDGWLTKKNGDRCFGCNKSKGYFETFSAPTIAEVVMWLYEKHKIWINIAPYNDEDLSQTLWENSIIDIGDDYNDCSDYTFYHSPTEALEAALLYTLKNLI